MKRRYGSLSFLLLSLLLFLCYVHLVEALPDQEIFISKDGRDDHGCGSIVNKCKSFISASKKFEKENNRFTIITIDSGTNEPWFYEVHETIELPSNVLIRKNPLSVTKPIIHSTQTSSQKWMRAFKSAAGSKSNVSIESVDFQQLFIIRCEEVSHCFINIKSSTAILKSSYIKREDGMISALPLASSSITIEDSIFETNSRALYIEPRANSRVNISIESTQFKGSTVRFESNEYTHPATLSLFRLNNVSFTRCLQSPILIFGVLNTMILTNSVFAEILTARMSTETSLISVNEKEIPFQKMHETRSIILSNNSIINNRDIWGMLTTSNTRTIHITNITFIGNMISRLFTFQNSSKITLKDLKAYRNTINEDSVTVLDTAQASFFNLYLNENIFNRAIINLTSLTEFSLTKFRLQDTNCKYDHCIHIENSSAMISELLISKNNIQRLFNGFQNKNITIERVQVSSTQMSSFWTSKSTTTLSLKNMKFNGIQGYDRASALVSHEATQYLVRHQSHLSAIELYNVKLWTGIHVAATNINMTEITIRKCHFNNSAFYFKGVENHTITNAILSQNTVEDLIKMEHKSQNVTFRDLDIFHNTVNKNILFCQQSENLEMTNIEVYDNTIDLNVLTLFLTRFRLKDIKIYNNIYLTGVSISNCNANISGLTIAGNTATGSTREFHYAEFYFLYTNAEKQRLERCVRNENYTLTISNTIINTSVATPSSTHHHSVSFTLTVPQVVMKNFTINLEDHQTAAFEMYVNKRRPEFFQPDILVNCPVGASPRLSNDTSKNLAFKYEVICQPCARDTYSVKRGRIHLMNVTKTKRNIHRSVEIIDSIHVLNNETVNVKCFKCSVGGDCNHGRSTSRGNFYGFIKDELFITYVPCPLGYCCSNRGNSVCKHFKTCKPGREGVLCGQCHPDLQENFFDTSCVPRGKCTKQLEFWFIFLLAILIVFLLVCFFDTFLDFLFVLVPHKVPPSKENVRETLSSSTTISTTTTTTTENMMSMEEIRNESCTGNSAINNTNEPNDSASNNANEFDKDSLSNDARSTCSTENILFTSKADEEEEGEREGNAAIETEDTCKVSGDQYISTDSITFDIKDNFLGPGIREAFVSFYQLRSLIAVEVIYENPFTEKISDIFNGGVLFTFCSAFCPYENLGVVDKSFHKYVLPSIIMVILLAVVAALSLVFEKRKGKGNRKLKYQLEVCYSKILLFNYKNVAYFCFLALNCVVVQNTSVLFINGNIRCFQTWQYIVLVFFIAWVLPFPFALYIAFDLYRKHSITYRETLICLTLPVTTVWFYHRSYLPASNGHHFTNYNPQQLFLVKRAYVEPYRLSGKSKDRFIFWEHWRLTQRLILAAISAFVVNPLYKVAVMVPCIVLFTITYVKFSPFKQKYWVLHWLEVTSMLSFFIVITSSSLNAFLYVYNVRDSGAIENLIQIFSYVEIIFSPIVVFALLLIIAFVFNRLEKVKKE